MSTSPFAAIGSGHRSSRFVGTTGGRQVSEPNLYLPSSRPAAEVETAEYINSIAPVRDRIDR